METIMHVFRNECDWYVATSPEDAAAACHELTGIPLDEIDPFVELNDEQPLTISEEGADPRVTKTCAEWARDNGRGFLCSTEF